MMFFSCITFCCWRCATISLLCIVLSANASPLDLLFTSLTRPKVPEPSTATTSRSSNLMSSREAFRTASSSSASLDRLALHDVLEGAKGLGEILSREHEALGGLDRGDRSVPLVRFQQSRLAEMPARLDLIHLGRRATVRFNHHLGGAGLDDVKGVALRALLDNVLALAILHKREEPRRLEPLLLLYRERERERNERVRTGTRRARRSRSQNSR